MPADPPSSSTLRASDADRDRVIDVLRAALAARTLGALAPLTADLIAAPGSDGGPNLPPAMIPAGPAAELLTIAGKHGTVRREGRWVLPHRLAVQTKWCSVLLDLTSAVRSGPELIIEMDVRGGDIELVLTPGMAVDANALAVKFTVLDISRDANDGTPETLSVRLAGRMKHGQIVTRWQAARPAAPGGY